MSHDVFISHSSRDKPVADGLCAALEQAGIRCWIAPRDLIAGRPFSGEIIRGIKSCRVMVLLFSSASNASPEVLREVQLATTHRLHLVNFRIEESGVSDDLAYFLGIPHWLDALTQPMREHYARLIESVQSLLALPPKEGAGPADEDEDPAESPARPHGGAHTPIISSKPKAPAWRSALTLAGLALIAFVVWYWGSPPSGQPKASTNTTPTPAPVPTPAGGSVITGPVTLVAKPTPAPTPEPPTAADLEPIAEPTPAMKTADAKTPWENSLGMKFVPVPIKGGPTNGQLVLFSIYETRLQDYAVFWAENPTLNAYWKLMEREGPTRPVVSIVWKDARAFCTWLTRREREAGTLPSGYRYRLASDHEWSCAVGLEEDASLPPMKKDKGNRVLFPWGTTWPPPAKAGNYGPIDGRENDGFITHAPVGSFTPNVYGIYDLGGNVREFCEDADPPGSGYHVIRGASFVSRLRDDQLASCRTTASEKMCPFDCGFRVVLSARVSAAHK